MKGAFPVLVGSKLWFPDPNQTDPEGLVAVGGELSIERLLLAYRSGIFPWTARPVTWWSPDPRAIFDLEHFHVPRSLAKEMRKGHFTFTIDRAFREVMEACAAPAEGRRSTWIEPPFLEAYTALHAAGHAHSIECWCQGKLAGGVYGVSIGGLFAGESMFHHVSNASKACLAFLVGELKNRGFVLFDIQMLTPVTSALGGMEIPRKEYLNRLAKAVACQPAKLATKPQ